MLQTIIRPGASGLVSYITFSHLSYVHRQKLHGYDVEDALETVDDLGDDYCTVLRLVVGSINDDI